MKKLLTLIFVTLFSLSSKSQQDVYIHVPAGQNGGAGGPVKVMTIQKPVELISGDIEPLIGVNRIFVKFDYASMAVCNFESEADYLEDLRKKHNSKKAGKEIEKWKTLPKRRLEPKFQEVFNLNAKKAGFQVSNDSLGSGAILIVKVLSEDPHFHTKRTNTEFSENIPPVLYLECTFLDKEGNFVARFNLKASGTKEPNLESSLEECYRIAGKMMAKDLIKRIREAQK